MQKILEPQEFLFFYATYKLEQIIANEGKIVVLSQIPMISWWLTCTLRPSREDSCFTQHANEDKFNLILNAFDVKELQQLVLVIYECLVDILA